MKNEKIKFNLDLAVLKKIQNQIDLNSYNPSDETDILKICDNAIKYKLRSVTIPSKYTSKAWDWLEKENIIISAFTEIKDDIEQIYNSANFAFNNGAKEFELYIKSVDEKFDLDTLTKSINAAQEGMKQKNLKVCFDFINIKTPSILKIIETTAALKANIKISGRSDIYILNLILDNLYLENKYKLNFAKNFILKNKLNLPLENFISTPTEKLIYEIESVQKIAKKILGDDFKENFSFSLNLKNFELIKNHLINDLKKDRLK